MARAGRLFIPLDVNWYDEWGHAVSTKAALLWVLAVGASKRLGTDGSLTRSQLRRLAPADMSNADLDLAITELCECSIAPISPRYRPDDGGKIGGRIEGEIEGNLGVELTGWDQWNGGSNDGAFGNHLRWHVKQKKPSLTCDFCFESEKVSPRYRPDDRPDIGGDMGGDSYRVEKSRVDKNLRANGQNEGMSTPSPFEDDFKECWKSYPRKIARKSALSAYTAQRNKSVDAPTLLKATLNFAEQMRREQRSEDKIMHGSTFYGPHDRWEDFVEPPPERVTVGPPRWEARAPQ